MQSAHAYSTMLFFFLKRSTRHQWPRLALASFALALRDVAPPGRHDSSFLTWSTRPRSRTPPHLVYTTAQPHASSFLTCEYTCSRRPGPHTGARSSAQRSLPALLDPCLKALLTGGRQDWSKMRSLLACGSQSGPFFPPTQ